MSGIKSRSVSSESRIWVRPMLGGDREPLSLENTPCSRAFPRVSVRPLSADHNLELFGASEVRTILGVPTRGPNGARQLSSPMPASLLRDERASLHRFGLTNHCVASNPTQATSIGFSSDQSNSRFKQPRSITGCLQHEADSAALWAEIGHGRKAAVEPCAAALPAYGRQRKSGAPKPLLGFGSKYGLSVLKHSYSIAPPVARADSMLQKRGPATSRTKTDGAVMRQRYLPHDDQDTDCWNCAAGATTVFL